MSHIKTGVRKRKTFAIVIAPPHTKFYMYEHNRRRKKRKSNCITSYCALCIISAMWSWKGKWFKIQCWVFVLLCWCLYGVPIKTHFIRIWIFLLCCKSLRFQWIFMKKHFVSVFLLGKYWNALLDFYVWLTQKPKNHMDLL